MQSKLIEDLSEEHRVIERLLASLLRVTAKAAVGDGVTKSAIRAHVELFAALLDALHHGREEEILFASLIDMGLPRQHGPVAVMLHEHQLGRELVGKLSRIANSVGFLSQSELSELAPAASDFAELLSSHIAKEDGVLYPMALGRLGANGLSQIDARAAEWEKKRTGERDRLLKQAGQLYQSTVAAADFANPARRVAAEGVA